MMGRPPGVVGRAQLKPDDLIRIQTLSRDARMGPSEIRRVTGYSIHQIKYALKKKTPTIGKRTGRPRKGEGSRNNEGGESAELEGDEGLEGLEGLEGGGGLEAGEGQSEGRSGEMEVDDGSQESVLSAFWWKSAGI